MLNLQQNRKNALDKIPEMFVNQKTKFLLSFTKTTIPSGVGEQRLGIHLIQLRLLLRRMMHDPCFKARGALL